jgi:hypothetical protein
VVAGVLFRQPYPLFDLPFAAPIVNFALEAECLHVAGIHLEDFMDLLQRERILLFFVSGACAFEQLGNRSPPDILIELRSQQRDLRIDVAAGLQFAENLAGELIVAGFERLRGAVDPGLNPRRVEQLDWLVVKSLLQRISKLLRAVVPMPRLLRHRLVNGAADGLTDRGVDL